MGFYTQDSGRTGWRDTADQSGDLQVRLNRGELIAYPFVPGEYTNENAGSSTFAFNASGFLINGDGTGSAITLVVPAGTPASPQGQRVWVTFYGRVFGIRFRRNSTTPNFTVTVDGVPHAVTALDGRLQPENMQITDGESYVIIADDLLEGQHHAEIVLPHTAASQTLVLYGVLVERRAGYSSARRPLHIISSLGAQTTNPVPTTATALALGSSSLQVRGLRKIIYSNPTGGAVTVTIQNIDASAVFQTMWSKSIAAGDTVDFDPGDLLAFVGGNVKHLASATGCFFTVLGGF